MDTNGQAGAHPPTPSAKAIAPSCTSPAGPDIASTPRRRRKGSRSGNQRKARRRLAREVRGGGGDIAARGPARPAEDACEVFSGDVLVRGWVEMRTAPTATSHFGNYRQGLARAGLSFIFQRNACPLRVAAGVGRSCGRLGATIPHRFPHGWAPFHMMFCALRV